MRGFEYNTEEMDENELIILNKFFAMRHETRLAILKLIRDSEQKYQLNHNDVEKYALTNEMLKDKLNKEYDIEIGYQLLGQHLKILREAGLIEQFKIPNPDHRGGIELNAYLLEKDAFEDLFLDVNFLTDELNKFITLSKEPLPSDSCLLIVFNGEDKGKKLIINKDEEVIIGRKANIQTNDVGQALFLLSNSYKTVSRISKPHLKIYYKNDKWYMLDEASKNGTYIYDNKIKKEYPLKNNSYIRLSKGPGSALIYCKFDEN